jgi:PIN domain nuclease of toxin-antitoxin system
VSAISCWEVAYLEKRNRVVLSLSIGEWLREALEGSSILCLPLTANIAAKAAGLPDIHRDPADRFIIATALELNTKLITFDHLIKNYPELAGSLL